MGTMSPTSSQDGSSRTFRASQGLGGKTGKTARRSYPPFLRGWPKAILVTTAPVSGTAREADDVIAVGWPGWAPPEVVQGILEPLLAQVALPKDAEATPESPTWESA
jgi:hypothetical protein